VKEAHGEGFVTETGRLLGVRAGVPGLNGGAIAAPEIAGQLESIDTSTKKTWNRKTLTLIRV
jgi:hypothetical protein